MKLCQKTGWLQRSMDCVASAAVSELEVEQLRGGLAYAGAAQSYAGWRESAEPLGQRWSQSGRRFQGLRLVVTERR